MSQATQSKDNTHHQNDNDNDNENETMTITVKANMKPTRSTTTSRDSRKETPQNWFNTIATPRGLGPGRASRVRQAGSAGRSLGSTRGW